MGRLVIVTGPSCVGKTPLVRALGRFHPDLGARLRAPVLYTTRAPRPGERDGREYQFRDWAQVEALRSVPGHLVLEVRRDLQALALDDVRAVLREGNDALFEGNPYVAAALLEAADFAAVPRTSLFISPLAAAEIRALRDRAPGEIQGVVADVMRRKLLRRTERQKGSVGAADRDDIEARCGAAWRELRLAPRFERVVANHDGEDSENWDAFPVPVGDARRTLEAFVDVLEGREPPGTERWTDELVSA